MKRVGPIPRYGGKSLKAAEIVAHLPRARLYVEPSVGGGGLFYAIPAGTYPCEVINDIDHALVTFFRVLRDRPTDLRRVLLATPYSREEFRLALEPSEDPLEQARRVWIQARQSFAGVGRHWQPPRPRDPLPMRPFHGDAVIDDLEVFAERLRHVAIECADAIDLIVRYAAPDVAFYCDPPYLPSTRKTHGKDAYRHEMSQEDHERLLAACLDAAAAGAHVAISGYPSETYDTALGGWRVVDMVSRAGHRGRIETRIERLWMSYPAEVELGAPGAQRALDLEVRP